MTAIEFENISKQYRLGLVSTRTLSHDLQRWWTMNVLRREDPYLKIGETNDRAHKGSSEYVWALKDINFKVEQGDVVGIIGKNGAGKSTLLKLLSKVTGPTTGCIRARGRIGSLLEVGTGFHQEMTGRENIYLNGAILGMTKSEITRKLDEIVDFSGCERYIDTPVKRYSSGMMVRLGFAVAAHLDPEILVVDEVLAVGDAEFQKKAVGKMQDVSRGEGRTVLFVSHNMAAVKSLCRTGVVLDRGSVVFMGPASDSVNYYLENGNISSFDKRILDAVKFTKSSVRLTRISINGTEKCFSTIVSGQHSLELEVEGYAEEPISTDLMMIIKNRDDVPMASFAEGHSKGKLENISAGNFRIIKRVALPKFLSRGEYLVDLYMHHPMVEWHMEAPACAVLDIQGYQEGYGRALNCSDEGFVGLESL